MPNDAPSSGPCSGCRGVGVDVRGALRLSLEVAPENAYACVPHDQAVLPGLLATPNCFLLSSDPSWHGVEPLFEGHEDLYRSLFDSVRMLENLRFANGSRRPNPWKTSNEGPITTARPRGPGRTAGPCDARSSRRRHSQEQANPRTAQDRGDAPRAGCRRGRGKHALYDWKVIRPWLTERFRVMLPKKFPANLRKSSANRH